MLTEPLAAFEGQLRSLAQSRQIWAPLLLLVALLFPLDIAIRRVMLGRSDFAKAAAWIQEKLPWVSRPSSRSARDPVLGELFEARNRVRQRHARQSESPTAPRSEKPAQPQPPAGQAAPEKEAGEQTQPETQETESDTLARLRSAKNARSAGARSSSWLFALDQGDGFDLPQQQPQGALQVFLLQDDGRIAHAGPDRNLGRPEDARVDQGPHRLRQAKGETAPVG